MKGEHTEYRVGVGASSILMILVALALTALSLLALGSARNTAALTARNVEMTEAYYQAAAELQQRLAAIDQAVLGYRQQSDAAFDETWFSACGVEAIWTENDGGLDFLLEIPAGERRVLRATGAAYPRGDERCVLKTHELLPGEENEQDQAGLNLMGIE